MPAAVVFDLGRGGSFTNRPDAAFGRRAISAARRGQRAWGSVGAGTGAKAGGLQGGVGTASTTVVISGETIGTPGAALTVTVGALAVVNANGSPVDPTSGLPWELPRASKRPTSSERTRLRAALDGRLDGQAASLNTTIGVVATSARLTKAEATKLAGVAHDGLARAIRPAHSMFDGDTVFALATGEHELGDQPAAMRTTASRQRGLNQLLVAAADTFSSACAHAVLAAERRGEFPAYRDLCPSLFI